MNVILVLSIILLSLGGLFMLIGAVGVIRFPDFYTRLHAAGMGDTLGQGLVLLGLALPVFAVGFGQVAFKLLLIMLFVFVFNPTATHALARGAWVVGLKPWKKGDEQAPSMPVDHDDDRTPEHDRQPDEGEEA